METTTGPNFPMASSETRTRLYSLCFFAPGQIVPAVELIEALDDRHAMLLAREKRPSLVRELWDRHRFVARLNSRQNEAA